MKRKIHKQSNKQQNFNNNNNNNNIKIAEELSQPNENSDAKQEGIKHAKARLGEVLKNGKTK
jgi:hypothetical protein